MAQVDQEQKEALKKLRKQRKKWIKKASAVMKTQKKAIQAITAQLQDDVGTVPAIADATGISPDKVLWYIAALKKYGKVVEGEKDGGYFKYIPVEGALEDAADNGREELHDTV